MLRCPRPRPRGLAAPRSIRPRCARAPLGGQMRSAPRNKLLKLTFIFNKKHSLDDAKFSKSSNCITRNEAV